MAASADDLAFLEENKSKEGVVTLASGLQYKVLEEGGGLDHPTVSTPCECHYAGASPVVARVWSMPRCPTTCGCTTRWVIPYQ